jgi:hypothetical protein
MFTSKKSITVQKSWFFFSILDRGKSLVAMLFGLVIASICCFNDVPFLVDHVNLCRWNIECEKKRRDV